MHHPITITVDEAPPGSGKTTAVQRDVVIAREPYLLVIERKDGCREMASALTALNQQVGGNLIVRIINDQTSTNVKADIEACPDLHEGQHVAVICTHAGFYRADLRDFTGWHLVIDETPAVLTTDTVKTFCDAAFFEANYELAAVAGHSRWSTVQLTGSVTARDLAQDDSHAHLRCFHSRVEDARRYPDRDVICSLTEWRQMSEPVFDDDGRRSAQEWIWGTIFTADALAAFTSVKILANRFTQSLSYKLLTERAAAAGSPIDWRIRNTKRAIEWARRPVLVRYFAERRASSFLFNSIEGRENLTKIAEWLAPRMSADAIWSANEAILGSLVALPQARRLRPRQAGTNLYAGCHEAAMFYTAKPSPLVGALLKLNAVSSDDWIQSNEFEAILQFVTRTSIRDPLSTEPVTITVYDRDQAAYIADYLAQLDHVDASVERIDLDLHDVMRRRGPKPRALTEAEIEERAAKLRHQKSEWARKTRNAQKGGAL